MQRLARFFSTLLSPLLMPTYGVFLALWVSILSYLPVGTRLVVMIVIFGITCILPMVFIAVLHSRKIIKDKHLNNRDERWLPYLFVVLCYVGATLYLNHVHSPEWLTAFMWGGTMAALVSFGINFFWKISAHLSGIGGVTAFLCWLYVEGLGAFGLLWLICAMIILSGILGTSRLELERHTFWQVVAGYASGFLWVILACRFLS